jgi:hypothetical protein
MMNCTAYQLPSQRSGKPTCAEEDLVGKREPFRRQDARELQPLRRHAGQKSRQLKSEARPTGEQILECYRLPVDFAGSRHLVGLHISISRRLPDGQSGAIWGPITGPGFRDPDRAVTSGLPTTHLRTHDSRGHTCGSMCRFTWTGKVLRPPATVLLWRKIHHEA